MIAGRIVGVIAILLISLAGYYMFRHEEGEQEIIVDTKHHEQIESKALIGQHGGSEDSHIMNTSVTAREKMTLADHTEDTFLMPDTDSVTVNPQSIISDDILISETVEDSLGANAKAPVTRTIPQPGIDIAEGFSKKTKKWQFLAAGSLGPALVQSVYKLIATNSASLPVTDASGISSGFPEPDSPVLPEPDIPSHELPDLINTWEDYGKYLKTVSSPDVSDVLILSPPDVSDDLLSDTSDDEDVDLSANLVLDGLLEDERDEVELELVAEELDVLPDGSYGLCNLSNSTFLFSYSSGVIELIPLK